MALVDGKTYIILVGSTNVATTNENGRLVLRENTSAENQKWVAKDIGGRWAFESKAGKKLFIAAAGWDNVLEARNYDPNDNEWVQWSAIQAGSRYQFQNRAEYTGFIDGTTMGTGDRVILYTQNNPVSDNQTWTVRQV